jgi:hypothetical protein
VIVRSPLVLFCLVLAVGGVSCGKRNAAKGPDTDAKLQEKLEGTWTDEHTGTNILETHTLVFSNGGFESRALVKDRSNLVQHFQIAGTYQIRNGWLINNITNRRNPLTNQENLSEVQSNQIVRLTDRELVLNVRVTNGPSHGPESFEVSFRKEEK